MLVSHSEHNPKHLTFQATRENTRNCKNDDTFNFLFEFVLLVLVIISSPSVGFFSEAVDFDVF